MNSRVNRSIGVKPKDINNEHYLQVLYTAVKDRKVPKPKLKSGNKVRLAIEDYNFPKGTNHNLRTTFIKLKRCLRGSL